MTDSFVRSYPLSLLDEHRTPCLSLYQPTHRRLPDNRQDVVRFRNLLRSLEATLARRHETREIDVLLAPFRRLADDDNFWMYTLDGLAVFGAPDTFHVFRLQRPVPELAIAANSFHLKPLLRLSQAIDRYQILGLARGDVRLYEGNRDVLDAVPLAPGVPRTAAEALGDQLTEPHLTVASYGGAGGPAMRHGHGGRKDEIDDDTRRFFRIVDRAVLEGHSRPSGLPLLLATLPEHQSAFREVSHNPHLLPERLDVHPESVGIDVLRERAWQVLEPRFEQRRADAIDRFHAAAARGQGADRLEAIATAVVAGRVGTLIVDGDRRVPGRLDVNEGRIERVDDLEQPDVDDLLDDLGEQVLRRGGDVIVVPAGHMPTDAGAAAIFRF